MSGIGILHPVSLGVLVAAEGGEVSFRFVEIVVRPNVVVLGTVVVLVDDVIATLVSSEKAFPAIRMIEIHQIKVAIALVLRFTILFHGENAT